MASPAPPPSPKGSWPGRGAPAARPLREDVLRVLGRYGAPASYPELPRALAGARAPGPQPRRPGGLAAAPATGGGALLGSRLAADVAPDAVVTPFGLGSPAGEEAGRRAVQFAWGRALLEPACVEDSRAAVLECHLRSLSAVFAMLVQELPREPTPAGASPEAGRPGGDGAEGPPGAAAAWGLGVVRALTAWLEEAALHPEPRQRDGLLDVAVLLSGLVRTRTELVKLRGQASSPQLEAERQAADAVRIHLGFLERLATQAAAPLGGLAEKCGQWQDVFERLTLAFPAARGPAVGVPGAGGGAAADRSRLTAWRHVRPGAKLVDERAEEVSVATSPCAPQVRILTALDGAAPLHSLSMQAPAAFSRSPTQQTIHHHRSPSPPLRFSSGPAMSCVWPAQIPVVAGIPTAPQQAPPSSVPTLSAFRPMHICNSVAALGIPPQHAGPQPFAPAPAPAPGPARLVSRTTLRLSTSPEAGLQAVRSQTPLVVRQTSCAGARWVSPTVVRRATTPVPPRLQRQGSLAGAPPGTPGSGAPGAGAGAGAPCAGAGAGALGVGLAAGASACAWGGASGGASVEVAPAAAKPPATASEQCAETPGPDVAQEPDEGSDSDEEGASSPDAQPLLASVGALMGVE